MAALVQAYPQQSGTVTILQTRPASSSAMMSSGQIPNGQQYGHGASQPRSSMHSVNASGPVVYRNGSAPIQPYAFTSTPSLNQWQQFRPARTSSTPAVPTAQTLDYGHQPKRVLYPASASMTNLPSTNPLGMQSLGSRDDSALPAPGMRRIATATPRPQSMYLAGNAPQQAPGAASTAAKVSPERYRRPSARSSDSTGSSTGQQPQQQPLVQPLVSPTSAKLAPTVNYGNAINGQGQVPHLRPRTFSPASRPNSYVGTATAAADDMQLYRGSVQEDVKRFRRRSLPALDSAIFVRPLASPERKQPDDSVRSEQLAAKVTDQEHQSTRLTVKSDNVVHARSGSADSRVSSRSGGSSSRPSSVSACLSLPYFSFFSFFLGLVLRSLQRSGMSFCPITAALCAIECYLMQDESLTGSCFHFPSRPTATPMHLPPPATPPCSPRPRLTSPAQRKTTRGW